MTRDCFPKIRIGILLLLAFLLLPKVSAQYLSASKLSVHLINAHTAGSSNIVNGGPRVFKVLAMTNGFPGGMLDAMRDYKAKVPQGKLVVRVYTPRSYTTNDNPTLSAGDYWTNHIRAALNTLSPSDKALIDYLEGPNEGDTPTISYPWDNAVLASQWFNQFWTNLTPYIVDAGFKPCIGSIAVGNPGNTSDLSYFVPALRQAKAAGGAWSYHAYTINYTTDVGTEIWYSLRYRQFYSYFTANFPDLVDMPLILTEGGVDFSGSPTQSGWQARGSAANYQRWLNWFDQRMQEDSYVLGCTLFQNGDPGGWASFDLETVMNGAQPGVVPIAGWLGNYLKNPTDFPPPPTGLSATALGNKIQISWSSIPNNPTSYKVKRASSSGGPYVTVVSGVSEGMDSTIFTDLTAPGGVPSYYVVSAVTAFGESDDSIEVSATPGLPKINCGGGAASPFSDDAYFSGGQTYAPSDAINTNGVNNPAPMAVYQSQRYGNLTYTIPNLPPNTSYKVRLHFAEVYYVFNSPGQRVFNVFINGAKVLNNFDIWAAAGGQFKANVQEFNAISDANGKISIELVTVVDNASINGIEILANATNTIPSAPSNLTANAGSGKIVLNWTAPAGATSFKIKRATTTGGPYTTIASGITSASFADTSATPGTTFYYVVSAQNALGESGNSNQAGAMATNALPDAIATTLFWSNASVAPGNSVFFKVTVKNQGAASIAANTLGVGFLVDGVQVSYVGANNATLAPGASATYTANGGPNNGAWIATPGNHVVTAVVDDINRFAEGDEGNNLFSVPLSVSVSGYAINAGGNAVGNFAGDANFSGSTNILTSVGNVIDLSGASNAAPQSVYQSERWGPTKYTFANLVPGKRYKARLHFSEVSPSITQAEDRQFNVLINGTQVLTNFDIFSAAGGKFRAVTKQFNTAADGLGNLLVHFARGAANEPKINGIEIFPYTNTAPVLTSIGTKIVNAGATLLYTNSASDVDWPADALTFSAAGIPPAIGSLDPITGVISWTAAQTTVGATNLVSITVTDNGTPPLSDTKTMVIITVPPPRLTSATFQNEILNLAWQSYPGKNYAIEFKNDLNETNWTALASNILANGSSAFFTNNVAGNPKRFYRIVQQD